MTLSFSARSHQLWMRASLPDCLNLVHKLVDHSRAHVFEHRTAEQDLQRHGWRDRIAVPHVSAVRYFNLCSFDPCRTDKRSRLFVFFQQFLSSPDEIIRIGAAAKMCNVKFIQILKFILYVTTLI